MQATLDSEIVSWIGRLGAAGVRHVMARFGISRKWAFDRLTPLVRDGLLTQHRLLHGRPGLYVATRKGLRWGGLTGLRVFTITPSRFEHAWQIADVAVAVARGLPDWLVLSDREILRHERQQRELLASVRVGSRGGGVAALHRPDLALISPPRARRRGRDRAIAEAALFARRYLRRLGASAARRRGVLPRDRRPDPWGGLGREEDARGGPPEDPPTGADRGDRAARARGSRGRRR